MKVTIEKSDNDIFKVGNELKSKKSDLIVICTGHNEDNDGFQGVVIRGNEDHKKGYRLYSVAVSI